MILQLQQVSLFLFQYIFYDDWLAADVTLRVGGVVLIIYPKVGIQFCQRKASALLAEEISGTLVTDRQPGNIDQ
jgi:hypothetical protein